MLAGGSLTGLDLSPEMLGQARFRAREQARHVQLVEGDARSLAFADETFDTVVFSLSLCTIPDDRRAMREARRVLRPGGRLLLLEHVKSPNLAVRLGQRLLDPMTTRIQADHLLREPLGHVRGGGLVIESVVRGGWGIAEAGDHGARQGPQAHG